MKLELHPQIPGDSSLSSLLSTVPVDIKAKVVTASGDVAECIEFSLTLGGATEQDKAEAE